MLNYVLKCFGGKKENKTHEILGYTPVELFSHLQKHPNWEECRSLDWHIDHIFPVKAFVDYKIFNVKLINCFDNLQPMLGSDNLSKNDKYNARHFEIWLKEHEPLYTVQIK